MHPPYIKIETIHDAASWGEVEVAREFLKHNPAAANEQNKASLTPLQIAARRGHRKFVEFLLTCGANINEETKSGFNALHMAMMWKLVELPPKIKWLTQEEYLAKQKDAEETVDLLRRQGAIADLYTAAGLGYEDELKGQLESDPSKAQARDFLGSTPLHFAVLGGSIATTKLLLSKGADPNARSKQIRQVLRVATLRGYNEIADLLRQHGAKE